MAFLRQCLQELRARQCDGEEWGPQLPEPAPRREQRVAPRRPPFRTVESPEWKPMNGSGEAWVAQDAAAGCCYPASPA